MTQEPTAIDYGHLFPSMDDDIMLFCRIEAMRRQEEGVYSCSRHHFSPRTAQDPSHCCSHLPIDEECRTKMVDWMFQLCGVCNLSRENVSIAISHLDRFIQTQQGAKAMKDRHDFQLAAMAAIYLSIKCYEPEKISAKQMSEVSQEHHSSDEVEQMELVMLGALQWRANPPTALAFVHHFLSLLLTEEIDKSFCRDLLSFSKFQVELAIRDIFFVDVKPSLIAYAAILNALASLGVENLSSCALVVESFHKIENMRPIASSASELREVRERLCQAFLDEGAKDLQPSALHLSPSGIGPGAKNGELELGNESPRCVSQKLPQPASAELFLCGLLEALAFM